MAKSLRRYLAPCAVGISLLIASACTAAPSPSAPPATTSSAPAAATSAAPTAATSAAPAAATSAAPAAAATTAAPAAAAPTAAPAAAPAKVFEYNTTLLSDLSGPAAINFRQSDPVNKSAFAYWNDTKGKDLGIKVNEKVYDTRYDVSQTASLWPGVLGNDRPVAVMGSSAHTAALGERLPSDKVAIFSGTSTTSSNWRTGQWVFAALPTYVHMTAGFLDWQLSTWKENRPLRFGMITSQQSPSFVDMVKGVEGFFAKGLYTGKVEFTGVEWVTTTSVDVSSEFKRLLDKKTDYIGVMIQTPVVAAIVRAREQYKAENSVKLLMYTGVGILTNASAIPLKSMEGDYEISPLVSDASTNVEGFRVYEQYKGKLGASDIPWSATGETGMIQALMTVRGIERAAKTVGPDKITGEAVYNAMFSGPFTSEELLGLSSGLVFTKDAPFPTTNLKYSVSTVKDGKHQMAVPGWVPGRELPKW